MLRILFICLLLSTLSCEMVNENVKAAFNQKYPNAENVRWNIDKNLYLEAKFELDGKKLRADFKKSGDWVETEQNIKYKDLPKPIKDAIKVDYDKSKIVEIEKVDSAKKGLFYDVEFKKNGGKVDIEFNELGIIIGTE